MSKKALRSPLKLLAATSVAIFSLLAVFTSTAAWFDSQRSLNNGANQMEVKNINSFKSLELYQPLSVGGVTVGQTDVTYVFDSTAVNTYTSTSHDNDNTVYLGGGSSDSTAAYSTLSPYHPLLMVVEYESAIPTALYINAKTEERFICPVNGDTGSVISREINGEDGPYPLSSVVHFSTKCYSSRAAFLADQPSAWTYSRNTLQSNAWQQASFASVPHGGGFAYEQQITVCNDISGTTTVVAIMMEYDIAVVSAISSYYMGEAFISSSDTRLPFVCDWTMEI